MRKVRLPPGLGTHVIWVRVYELVQSEAQPRVVADHFNGPGPDAESQQSGSARHEHEPEPLRP